MVKLTLRNSILGALALVVFEASAAPEISFNGFFEGYYSYNFNDPSPGSTPASNTYRYYDTDHNQMTLNLAEFTVQAKFPNTKLLVDFDFGPFADLNATNGTVDETSKNIGQAVLTYHKTSSRFYFDAGKMYSHVGLETVKSKDNFNYSRSVLFSYGMPFWHTGVRFGYDLAPSKLQGNLYVYNGWNSQNEVNRSKTIGAQLKFTPSSEWTIIYNYIGGPEQSTTESKMKVVHDLNATWVLNASWTLALDALSGSEDQNKWYGGLLMAKYQLNPESYISPRYEVYRDQDGATLTGGSQTVQSYVMTYGKNLSEGLDFRSEVRTDSSDKNNFVGHDGNKKTQTSALVALLFQF